MNLEDEPTNKKRPTSKSISSSQKNPQNMVSNEKLLNVVMTGGTAGIGAYALDKFAKERNLQLFLGARGKNRNVPTGITVINLDLSSLTSVKQFAETLAHQLEDQDIDILVLNAGMQSGTNEKRSIDGWELTFAVNHLAHFYLVQLLTPYMAKEGRIIITTSDTHDPKVTPIAPKSFQIKEWANPTQTGFGTGIRAYAATKLCNLMVSDKLRREPSVIENNIQVIAFNPGFTGGTSLGRDSSTLSKVIVKIMINTVFRIVGWFKHEYRIGKPEIAGTKLAEVSLGKISLPAGSFYISLVDGKETFPSPSELALDIEKQEILWKMSEKMIKL